MCWSNKILLCLVLIELLGVPCFLLFGPSGSQFLLEPSSGWVEAILSSPWVLSPRIPNLLLCPYNYPLLSWYFSSFKNIDNFKCFHIKHWDLWKDVPFKNKHFLSPKLPRSVPCPLVLLLAITRIFCRTSMQLQNFRREQKVTLVSASRLICYTCFFLELWFL